MGTQAVLNVLLGARYKIISQEVKDIARRLYGRPRPPAQTPSWSKLAIGDEERITERPADRIAPG